MPQINLYCSLTMSPKWFIPSLYVCLPMECSRLCISILFKFFSQTIRLHPSSFCVERDNTEFHILLCFQLVHVHLKPAISLQSNTYFMVFFTVPVLPQLPMFIQLLVQSWSSKYCTEAQRERCQIHPHDQNTAGGNNNRSDMLQQVTMNGFIPCKDIKLKHVHGIVLFYHPFSPNILGTNVQGLIWNISLVDHNYNIKSHDYEIKKKI